MRTHASSLIHSKALRLSEPVLDDPVWDPIVGGISDHEHGVVQFIGAAAVVVKHSTGVELVGVAGRIHRCTANVNKTA